MKKYKKWINLIKILKKSSLWTKTSFILMNKIMEKFSKLAFNHLEFMIWKIVKVRNLKNNKKGLLKQLVRKVIIFIVQAYRIYSQWAKLQNKIIVN